MTERYRLADQLAGLSIVADLGYRLPVETTLRSCLLATALGRGMELPERDVADVFYVSLLFHVGCVAYSHETTTLFGDDLTVNHAVIQTDITDLRDIITTLIPLSTHGLPLVERVRSMARMTTRGQAFGRAHNQASCEVAREVARRIGLPDSVSAGLYDVHEWWNGRGARGTRGDDISLPARVARVASEASELGCFAEADSVAEALRHRAGKTLDPAVVDAFNRNAESLGGYASEGDPRMRLLEAEPTPVVKIDGADLPRVAHAFGDLADLKTPFTHGHASGVAHLAVAAAEVLRLDRHTVVQLEVAAYLHDLGRIGVSNRVWEKPGPLTTGEWEQVKLHAYYSERILSSTAVLAPSASIVGMHHERVDGSGYHRGSRSDAITVAARVLAAADAFQAMTQVRPHRAALQPEIARDELLEEARAGRLDGEAVGAVLDAAGQSHPLTRHAVHPAGLTDREVEVLGLVADGCSNPEIGRRLDISRRTAEHHVQHIYTKIGVSSRAAAALFALEHGLLDRP